MNQRRNFLKAASAIAIPAAALAVSSGVALADDGSVQDFLGTWDSVHSLPFPPGRFREFLSFADGGVLHETNSFLNTASNLDFSLYGLPNVINASDGFGNWTRVGNGAIEVVFRKMLFDGGRQNFGDLRATGKLTSNGIKLYGDWFVEVILADRIVPLGPATSEGTRLK
jgi:hypothetical protein